MRSALVIGHPGHELLVHGWLEEARPVVFVFTDGSGRSTQSRLASTTKILNRAGARGGSVYGRLTDAAAYAAILNHEFETFTGIAGELADALVAEQIDHVAGDACEGYNPVHDVCRAVINAAVKVAEQVSGRRTENLAFSLIGKRTGSHQEPHTDGICRLLDDAALARKIAAARGYVELTGDVQEALARTPVEVFKVECLRPVSSGLSDYPSDQQAFYESYGEKQVAAGHYPKVLRYQEHIVPLVEELTRYAAGRR